jgi:DNA repair protein RadC
VNGLALDDRPREKLARLGVSALGDNELLAIVIGSGTRAHGALGVANNVLDATDGVHGLAHFTRDELRRVNGVGTAKASQILAAIELGRRTLIRVPSARRALESPQDVASYLLPRFGARAVEHFGIVLLDVRHRLLRTAVISIGTLDSSLVHPREVFREAASGRASAIVLFHNHPSGDPAPSTDDLALTRRLVKAGQLMGIDVLDHVILTDTQFVSLRASGRLTP